MRGCYLLSKGKDFQAIHNVALGKDTRLVAVTYWVKVKIFKQFTTYYNTMKINIMLLLTE